ncbi:fructan beta-fructosidase [Leeuwenhoekiella aestuarii]|uniref:Fructan beta-fructosidase n=1 Tax=Leeuwenhoekiella aestuarii TaxID=2249426 RepID=A0A4Q0NQI4_9FLAO|nr:glycoside hydrolase family 32 protein [Leeuwenhoekiella aestuarii]RXG11693.1 fructan beta-fructosidase [Leeuwenhoekiella aestuarii]RXG12748.1 fructan beta-fructosidase [Leeuwenhoekiella aestuarii]
MKYLSSILLVFLIMTACKKENTTNATPKDTVVEAYYENFRPQYHFSPEAHWMNDPNGLVYNDGTYHLYYQFYPDSTVWGPMHWGHATSKDLKKWHNEPVVLKPDSLGYIFSGSAVVDHNNTSGFGTSQNPPLVAMFTYHDPVAAAQKTTNYQYQGIAYSIDNGQTFTKYANNPVVPNSDNLVDFRDPKVFWHEASQKWVLLLVGGDRAMIYNSDNLKEWTYLSDFGQNTGAHGGVWECPDLFPLTIEETGETKWVLLISINPGAPNGGSGTQYFIGEFDGKTFKTSQTEEKWIDLGRDNYAGITYNNLPYEERIFIGWMSNWDYGQVTPTEKWRSAMTLPRKLELNKNKAYFLTNKPVETLIENLQTDTLEIQEENGIYMFSHTELNQSKVAFDLPKPLNDFNIKLSNTDGEQLLISYDSEKQEYRLDRSKSGDITFSDSFALPIMKAPAKFKKGESADFSIYIDASSVEFFGDGGANALTAQFFPSKPYTEFSIETKDKPTTITLTPIPSIWKEN